jgi:hypothetical protein
VKDLQSNLKIKDWRKPLFFYPYFEFGRYIMLNKKLAKQIDYYRGKCWEYHNKMKFAGYFEQTKLQRQYDKNNAKYEEIRKKIESDGKHKVFWGPNGQLEIQEVHKENTGNMTRHECLDLLSSKEQDWCSLVELDNKKLLKLYNNICHDVLEEFSDMYPDRTGPF